MKSERKKIKKKRQNKTNEPKKKRGTSIREPKHASVG